MNSLIKDLDMIDRINIQNCRFIKELTLDPKSLCALISPSNSRKTNISRMIDLALGEEWLVEAI